MPRRPAAEINAMKNSVLVVVGAAKAQPLSAFVRRRARVFLEMLSLRGVELSITLVGDRRIQTINREWRDKDKATDVLSFPTGSLPRGFPRPHPLGDIVISIDTAIRVAKKEGCSLKEEVERYLAHGLLHLLGFDHHSEGEAKAMSKAENRLLGNRGMVFISRHGRTS